MQVSTTEHSAPQQQGQSLAGGDGRVKQFSKRSGGSRPAQDRGGRRQTCAKGARGGLGLDTGNSPTHPFHTRLPDTALPEEAVEEGAKSPNKK